MDIHDALELAAKYHRGQFDKSGVPYIYHPLAVMSKMYTEDERIVAVMHDLEEDTEFSLDMVTGKFSDDVIDALLRMNKHRYNSWDCYISAVTKNRISIKVKIADIEHNISPKRILARDKHDLQRLQKYVKTLGFLKGVLASWT